MRLVFLLAVLLGSLAATAATFSDSNGVITVRSRASANTSEDGTLKEDCVRGVYQTWKDLEDRSCKVLESTVCTIKDSGNPGAFEMVLYEAKVTYRCY